MYREDRKEIVASLICDEGIRPMRFRELCGFLQIPKEERSELSEILDALIKEGRIAVDSEGRYVDDKAIHVTGTFMASGRGFGFVRPEGLGRDDDIFIPEGKTLSAMNGDTVKAAVTLQAGIRDGRKKRAEGILVKIVERAHHDIVGVFMKKARGGLVRPDDARLGVMIAASNEHTKGAEDGQKVVVTIRDYGEHGHGPSGRITEILGNPDTPGIDILSVIRSYGIPTVFPEEVTDEAKSVSQTVSEREIKGRLDLRDVVTVTIDGDDAKDLDDAVTLEKCNDGFTLGVHIADVSHYVKEGSALDGEALHRGTSVYFCDRVIPMLPVELSNGICSLNAGEDRLALSCIMTFDTKGNLKDHRVAESVIHVNKRMSYSKVAAVLGGDVPGDYKEYETLLRQMAELSAILRKKREDRGAVDFDFPECKLIIGPDGQTEDIVPYERNDATRLIEDFMLAANETVAEHFFWTETPFVYRNHESPDPEKMNQLNIFLTNFGYHIHHNGETVHTKELQKLLHKIAGTPEEAVISRLTLRSMKQAKYAPECLGHFGLAARYYCHFTSPIRRYPDLQIHRIIKEELNGALSPVRMTHYENILTDVSNRSSVCERRADEAERETEKHKKAEFMRRFLGEEFDGVISGVTGWGLYVELPNTVEGMIRMEDLPGDYFRYEEANARLIGERSHRIYALGQRIRVLVAAVDTVASTIDFIPVVG